MEKLLLNRASAEKNYSQTSVETLRSRAYTTEIFKPLLEEEVRFDNSDGDKCSVRRENKVTAFVRDSEEDVEHPEEAPDFPLWRKILFKTGTALTIAGLVFGLVTPIPFVPDSLLWALPGILTMVLAVGRKHSWWHLKNSAKNIGRRFRKLNQKLFGKKPR